MRRELLHNEGRLGWRQPLVSYAGVDAQPSLHPSENAMDSTRRNAFEENRDTLLEQGIVEIALLTQLPLQPAPEHLNRIQLTVKLGQEDDFAVKFTGYLDKPLLLHRKVRLSREQVNRRLLSQALCFDATLL